MSVRQNKHSDNDAFGLFRHLLTLSGQSIETDHAALFHSMVAKNKMEKQLHVDNVLRTPEGRKVEIILTKLIFSFMCSSLFLFFRLCPQKLSPFVILLSLPW